MSTHTIAQSQNPLADSVSDEVNDPKPSNFFNRNSEERPEAVEGLIREGDLVALAGNYGKGKSPLLADLNIHLVNGRNWCGRRVSQRPVISIDFETPEPDYKKTIRNIAARVGVAVPRVPDEMQVFLYRAANEVATNRLLDAMAKAGIQPKIDLIESELKYKPNALVSIDPGKTMFSMQKESEIHSVYRDLRSMLRKFPRAAIICTFNLRKLDRKNGRADLLSEPRDWLEELSGSLDILNRCDVRLGIETHHDDVRVINGIVRGREMHPLLIRPVCDRNDQLAGFEQVTPDQSDLLIALTDKQKRHWDKLPVEFRFEQVADALVPRASLSRLLEKVAQLGALNRGGDGVYRKRDSGARN